MQWLWRMKRINRSLGTEVTDDNKASSSCRIPCNYCVTSAVRCFNFVCTSLGVCLCFCACMYELAQLLCLCLFWMRSPTAIYLIFLRYDSSFDLEVINLYEALPCRCRTALPPAAWLWHNWTNVLMLALHSLCQRSHFFLSTPNT